jgi:hypothetical protein
MYFETTQSLLPACPHLAGRAYPFPLRRSAQVNRPAQLYLRAHVAQRVHHFALPATPQVARLVHSGFRTVSPCLPSQRSVRFHAIGAAGWLRCAACRLLQLPHMKSCEPPPAQRYLPMLPHLNRHLCFRVGRGSGWDEGGWGGGGWDGGGGAARGGPIPPATGRESLRIDRSY